ncbi:MAG: glycosyltransferase family 4 protein [Hungatella sp.]|nr:glycosyltransferase family 4 protein [Hungatella sp.]
MEKCKCAIDLLWVRPKQVGGIESVARNLLDGFLLLNDDFELWLLVSKDNADSFKHYAKDLRFHIEVCDIRSANVGKRIIWQNIHFGKKVRSLGLNKCFEPYYCKPILGTRGVTFTTIIHDLQAIHYPEYFSKGKVAWMKFSWWNAIRTSKTVVAISEYVRNDILAQYKVRPEKVVTIYDPITVDKNDVADVSIIEDKYGIKKGEFFFTVSSLLPHKNVITLLDVMKEIKDKEIDLPKNLIVSGVGGKSREPLLERIQQLGLSDNVQLTPFIENDERNALYKYCKVFLFPSVFEGFGMPPIEAMLFETPVVTTRKTCLEEVTQGKANYVDDPYDISDWIRKIKMCSYISMDFSRFEITKIAREYLHELQRI